MGKPWTPMEDSLIIQNWRDQRTRARALIALRCAPWSRSSRAIYQRASILGAAMPRPELPWTEVEEAQLRAGFRPAGRSWEACAGKAARMKIDPHRRISGKWSPQEEIDLFTDKLPKGRTFSQAADKWATLTKVK